MGQDIQTQTEVNPKQVKVLDFGYVELIETWGSDERIIESARMSTGASFRGWGPIVCGECRGNGRVEILEHCSKCKGSGALPGDEKLLKFLWDNAHNSPFEFGGIVIEVQAPIFVFREWHRHRVPFGYNEMSSRYTPLPDVNYIPSIERLMIGSDGRNKQAGTITGAGVLTVEIAEKFQIELKRVYEDQEFVYQEALRSGVPKELARIHLPVGRYSRMRATGNLRGWLAFLSLRLATSAQWEIRQYAGEVCKLLTKHFPRTMDLFNTSRVPNT